MTQNLCAKGTYSNKVLVGDWLVSRQNEIPVKVENEKFSTIYSDSYTPKLPTKSSKTSAWDHRMDFEQSKIVSEVGKFDNSINNFGNFSTTYDLSYNHFPKCYKGTIPRILMFRKGCHEPTEEYLPSYGNITSYGISEYKRQEWNDELDWRSYKDKLSSYHADYLPPRSEDYKFKRFAPPVENSSRLCQINLMHLSMKLRHRGDFTVPQKNMLLGHKEKYCNPITWECTPDMVMKTAE